VHRFNANATTIAISKCRASTGLSRFSSRSWPHTVRKIVGEWAIVAHRCSNAGACVAQSSQSACRSGEIRSRVKG
jgi:hypothetical protein